MIQEAGAVGMIIAYLIEAFLVCLVMLCLGELTVHASNTAAFHTYASKYIHPGVEFISWNSVEIEYKIRKIKNKNVYKNMLYLI